MANTIQTNPRNLLVMKASAGSGKTYRLALEYIKHLLFTVADDSKTLVPRRATGDMRPLNAHRQLLAITFTNKATDEMKQRIVDELHRLSQPGVKSDYLDDFVKESKLTEDEVRALARQALNELLFDYSNFNVSTIDSFFQTILRNFARELDRDFNYDIQLEEDYAVRVTVHNFLLSLGKEGTPTQVDKWVQEYQRHMVRGDAETKSWKFFDDAGSLNKFAKNINTELFRSRMAEIRDYLGHVNEGTFECDFSKIRAFKKFMHDLVKLCNDRVEEGYEQLRTVLEPFVAAGTVKGSFKNWMEKGGNTPFDLKGTWKEITEEKVLGQFKVRQEPDGTIIQQLLDLMLDHRRQRLQADFFQHIEDNLGLLGMLAMIDIFLEEYRHETNSILIGDTNELIGTVLESGTDFVYERVGTMISHFMIDEFQDTSTKQYENFRGLLRESLSSGNFNMLIGDAKQSIYRFRNADLTVFRERVGEDFAADITDGRLPEEDPEAPTSTNYRSSRHIIEFNNALFKYLRERFQDRQPIVGTYGNVKQGMPENIDTDKLPGYVRLMTDNFKHVLDNEVINAAMPPGFSVPGDDDVAVEDVLPGYLLWLHQRYDWGRIGILVNSHSDGDKVVDCILDYNKRATGEKIHIISGESLLLNNSPIIRRIIAMLRFIDISQFNAAEEDEDDNTEASAKDDLWRRLKRKRQSDRRLYSALNEFIRAVSAQPGDDPQANGALLVKSLEAFSEDSAADESQGDASSPATGMLEQLLPSAGELTTLVSIVETIIAYFKHSGNDDVDREVAFLLAFQDTVMQFSSQRNGGSVREFLKFWDENKHKLAVSSADGGDAINIMTIHAAKGLEFDCVVIPYAKWEVDVNTQEKAYWMPREAFADAMHGMLPDGPTCEPGIVPPLLHVNKTATVELNRMGAFGEIATAFVNKQVDDVLIDNMNKTYVAMTRPRTELHIFTMGSSNTIAPLLTAFARESGVMTPVVGAEGWYEKGALSTLDDINALRKKKALQSAGNEPPKPERVDIDAYTVNAIPLQLRVRVEHASSSSIDAGLRLHGLLSRIHDCNDVDRVIDDGIKHGVITDDPDDPCSIDSVNAHVRDVIKDEHTRVAAWFDPANKVYSERTITTAGDSLWDEGGIQNVRPDRIVRLPDGQLIVIDYTSGERRDTTYLRQLNGYIAKLRLIFPNTPVSGRLWYVTHDLILDEQGKELGIRIYALGIRN